MNLPFRYNNWMATAFYMFKESSAYRGQQGSMLSSSPTNVKSKRNKWYD